MNKTLLPLFLAGILILYWFHKRTEREHVLVSKFVELICEKDLTSEIHKTLDNMKTDQAARVARAKGLSIDFEKSRESLYLFRAFSDQMRGSIPGLHENLVPIRYELESYRRKLSVLAMTRATIVCPEKVVDPDDTQEMVFLFLQYYAKIYH